MEMLVHMEMVVVKREQLIQQLTLTKSACAAAEYLQLHTLHSVDLHHMSTYIDSFVYSFLG